MASDNSTSSPSLLPQHILLVISGSVAAYKSLELIRRLKEEGCTITTILTEGGQQFITPMAVASLSGGQVYTDLFSLKDETEMGHIRLSREADIVLVAPASADLLAKLAHGRADCLASATLLASDKPITVIPAMNPQMWAKPATQRNIAQLQADGVHFIGPEAGEMACGETGAGRMTEPEAIVTALRSGHYTTSKTATSAHHFGQTLAGFHALVTAGPTYEPIDPVRFIGNRSSGKQGYAIAEALARAGARVTLVSGPVHLPRPVGVTIIPVETTEDMFAACKAAMPADILVSAAAVSDWKVHETAADKLKKRDDHTPPALSLEETTDILDKICHDADLCPTLTIGFAAETIADPQALIGAAREKKQRKGCDWIVANDVSNGHAFGADENSVHVITDSEVFTYKNKSKADIAGFLAQHIADFMPTPEGKTSTATSPKTSTLKAV